MPRQCFGRWIRGQKAGSFPIVCNCTVALQVFVQRFESPPRSTPNSLQTAAVDWGLGALQEQWIVAIRGVQLISMQNKRGRYRLQWVFRSFDDSILRAGLLKWTFIVTGTQWEQTEGCTLIVSRLWMLKSKAVPLHATTGERRYSSYSFSTSALDGGEWLVSRLGRAFVSKCSRNVLDVAGVLCIEFLWKDELERVVGLSSCCSVG
jgi:hypothetical protein